MPRDFNWFAFILTLLCLIGGIGAVVYASHAMRAGGYDAASVCGHMTQNSLQSWMAFFNAPTPNASGEMSKTTQEYQKGLIEAQNASRNDFIAVLTAVLTAEKTGIVKDGLLCVPQDVLAANTALPDAYAADVATRIKADPSTCKADYETDAVRFLERRYPCARPQL
jgi:hypothetical protein